MTRFVVHSSIANICTFGMSSGAVVCHCLRTLVAFWLTGHWRCHVMSMMSSTGSTTSDNDRQGALDDATDWPDSGPSDEHDGGTDRVQHNGHVPPVEPRSSFSSGADGDTLVHCGFDCGPPQPRKHMINKGNARSVCWVCNPCYCAMRAIIRSWSATPESKAMLDEMRCKDKLRWHALVRQCRIRPSTEEVGLADLRTRKKAVLDATQSMVQAFGAQDTADVLWLTKPRYIAHQIYVEGIDGGHAARQRSSGRCQVDT